MSGVPLAAVTETRAPDVRKLVSEIFVGGSPVEGEHKDDVPLPTFPESSSGASERVPNLKLPKTKAPGPASRSLPERLSSFISK